MADVAHLPACFLQEESRCPHNSERAIRPYAADYGQQAPLSHQATALQSV